MLSVHTVSITLLNKQFKIKLLVWFAKSTEDYTVFWPYLFKYLR